MGVRLYEGAVTLAFMGIVVTMFTAFIGFRIWVPAYFLAVCLFCSVSTIALVLLARFSDHFTLVERSSNFGWPVANSRYWPQVVDGPFSSESKPFLANQT